MLNLEKIWKSAQTEAEWLNSEHTQQFKLEILIEIYQPGNKK